MLSCRGAISRMGNLEGCDLAASQRRETARHLRRCRDCRSYWRSYRTTVSLTRAAFRSDEPGGLETPEDFVGKTLAAARRLARWPSSGCVVHLLSGIAAAPLLAFWLR
jgi:hypothetical protein